VLHKLSGKTEKDAEKKRTFMAYFSRISRMGITTANRFLREKRKRDTLLLVLSSQTRISCSSALPDSLCDMRPVWKYAAVSMF
jgi:hypothetical protein